MLNLNQQSKNSGLSIDKAVPHEEFYPVPEEYITLQNNAEWDSKKYDYWLDVVEHLDLPILLVDPESPLFPAAKN